jgi:hypothetical protein
MALGALLAALERDLPVAYLEAIGYNFANSRPADQPPPFLVHVWLEGEVYPQPRPALKSHWKRSPGSLYAPTDRQFSAPIQTCLLVLGQAEHVEMSCRSLQCLDGMSIPLHV